LTLTLYTQTTYSWSCCCWCTNCLPGWDALSCVCSLRVFIEDSTVSRSSTTNRK